MASIQKRPDGKWRARYRDEAGKEHARHFPRRVDAQRWLDEVAAAVVTGLYVDPRAGRITFAQYADKWSERQTWESSTRTSFNQTMRTVPFRDVPLGKLTRAHIERWVKDEAATKAPTTMQTRYIHVRQVLRGAVADKVIPLDVAAGVKLPRTRKAEHAMRLPTPAQVRAMLDASEPDGQLVIALCAFAGLRLGEVVALQVQDVDLEGRTLHVQRQRQRDEVRAPKFGSERVVALPDALVALLRSHLVNVRHPDGWLFVGERGPAQDNWAHYRFNKARKAAGCSQVTVHSMRHFYASGLIAAGCDVVTVQRALGHASPSVTLNTYSHLWPSAEDRTRTGAASIMESVNLADSGRTDGPSSAAD